MAGRSPKVVLLVLGTVLSLLLGAGIGGAGVVARRLSPPWTRLVLVGGPLAFLLAGELRRGGRRRAGPEAKRLAGDRAWLPPFSPARGRVTQSAHPSAHGRFPGADPVAHHTREDT